MISFTLVIEPKSTQFGSRMGINRRSGKLIMFSDKKKASYLATVASLAAPHRPATPLTGPLRVNLTFVLPRPQSLAGRKHPEGLIPCHRRPDRDNLQKGTQDGLTRAGFWLDDAQICDGRTVKYYAEKTGLPRIEVAIEALNAAL